DYYCLSYDSRLSAWVF
nr:immunoglobulin light chain junction region [Macaca mulatta]MOW31501.1 immunoglobulin light chain junction region [Macaca mulatta]